MKSRSGSDADRAVSAGLKAKAAADDARRARDAHAVRARLAPLKADIRAEIQPALDRLEAAGFPGARMLRLEGGRKFFGGIKNTDKAAWKLEEHPWKHKGETMAPASTWLLADGKIIVGGSQSDILDELVNEPVLHGILAGLRKLGH
jgi:hypothetical protein